MGVRIISSSTIVLLFLVWVSFGACNKIPKLYQIPQNGMYPSLPSGTELWINRLAYSKVEDIQRGDVIVFKYFEEGNYYDYIWRVIALPGDSVEVVNSRVKINSIPLKLIKLRDEGAKAIYSETNGTAEYSIALSRNSNTAKRENFLTKVEKNAVFVLGDNRDNAWDSRFHGAILFKNIIGKMM